MHEREYECVRGLDYTLQESQVLGLDPSGVFYKNISKSDLVEADSGIPSRLPNQCRVSSEALDHLGCFIPGDHSAALSWLKTYGPWRVGMPTPPAGARVPGDIEYLNGSRPSLWWAEAMQLQRARWLHKLLSKGPKELKSKGLHRYIGLAPGESHREWFRSGRPFTLSRFPPESSDDLGYSESVRGEFAESAGLRLYCHIIWPQEGPDWVRLGGPADITTDTPASKINLWEVLWQKLWSLFQDGLRRYYAPPRIYYDEERNQVVEAPSECANSLGAACWQIVKAEVLGGPPLRRCDWCGRYTRDKPGGRKTRKWCGSACSRAAERSRERERDEYG